MASPGVTEAALLRLATGAGRVLVAYLASTDSPGKPPDYDYSRVAMWRRALALGQPGGGAQ